MQHKKLKDEIKELKNVIIHLSINLFRDKKLSEEEILDLLADAVLKKQHPLEKSLNEFDENWRL